MYVVTADNRDSSAKVKKLRRQGIVPGCIYGGKLEETLLIQVTSGEAARLAREKAIGTQVLIEFGGQKQSALIKEISANQLANTIEHLSFQSLVADEPVNAVAQIVLLNEESVSDIVRQTLYEIPIRALPANLVEEIRIDLTGMEAGTAIRVEDLDIANNPDVELQTPGDVMVFNIIDKSSIKEEEPETEEGVLEGEEAEATEAAEESDSAEETE